MTRSLVTAAISNFLVDSYVGNVVIHREVDTEVLEPPYAVVRVSSSEIMAPGQYEIHDMTVLVGVFHDASVDSALTAEDAASQIFLTLEDPELIFTHPSSEALVWSAWERVSTEVSITEENWQHVAAFRAVVAPLN